MKEKKPSNFPLWMQVSLIVLVGVAISVSVLSLVQDIRTERFTVSFADNNGKLIEQKEVRSGMGIIPPVFDTDLVFRGWNVDLNNITTKVEAHPIFYRIVEDNLIYFNSVYVQEGKNFALNLNISGNVKVSNGEFVLNYDEDVLQYKSFKGNGITQITKSAPGKLLIKYNSEEVLTKKTQFAQIEFYAERKDAISSQIALNSNKAFLKINGEKKPVDCSTINNNIYFLQEVG